MSRKVWNDGQEVTFEDLTNISPALERTFMDNFILRLLKGQTNKVFGTSFTPTYVNSNTITIGAGAGVQQDSAQTTPEPIQRPLILDAAANVTITTPDPADDRIDIICIKAALADEVTADRKFKDAGTLEVSTVAMVVQKNWRAELLVVAGTPAGLPAAPATPAGYIKLAEVFVTNTTGVANQAAITDVRPRFALDGYDAIVGNLAYCTHTTLAAAVADVSAGAKIRVVVSETLQATVDLNKANLQIDFDPSVTITKGAGTKGLLVNEDGIRINGGRFVDYSTGGDKAIEIASGADFAILFGQRFNNCDTEVDDLSDTATVLASVTE